MGYNGEFEDEIIEYESLRDEIQRKVELHNNLITFTITTVVAIITVAFTKNVPYLFLVPFCIIIPASYRVAYYRLALSKLSAYIVVFLEDHIDGLNWETRNTYAINTTSKNNIKAVKNLVVSHYYDFFVLSSICYLFFGISYIKNANYEICLFKDICFLVFPLSLILWELIVTIRIGKANKIKNEWVKKWKEVKETETVKVSHLNNKN